MKNSNEIDDKKSKVIGSINDYILKQEDGLDKQIEVMQQYLDEYEAFVWHMFQQKPGDENIPSNLYNEALLKLKLLIRQKNLNLFFDDH